MALRYYRELLSFLSRKVADRSTAADLAQESYARVYAAHPDAESVREPRALLYRTARNLLVDEGRRGDVRERHEQAGDPEAGFGPAALEPEAALQSRQMVDAMLATIDALPPRCRQAFILHRFDGLSHAEVAARMGVSVKMVEQHVQNAVKACRRCRDEIDGATPPARPLRRGKRNPT